jgi:hypothetical protein
VERGHADVPSPPEAEPAWEELEPAFGWSDLVLPESEFRLLRAVTAKVRRRRRAEARREHERVGEKPPGPSLLFAGGAGTGKTMAAQALGSELGLAVFQVDLLNVFSAKGRGAMEIVDHIFAAGEGSGAIILFENADALPSVRSRNPRADARRGAAELARVVERSERYPGIVVVTTRLKQRNAALLDRFESVVTFPFPGSDTRLKIWTRHLPGDALLSDADLGFVASSFKLAGGTIAGCCARAITEAERRGGQVSLAQVAQAVEEEYRARDVSESTRRALQELRSMAAPPALEDQTSAEQDRAQPPSWRARRQTRQELRSTTALPEVGPDIPPEPQRSREPERPREHERAGGPSSQDRRRARQERAAALKRERERAAEQERAAALERKRAAEQERAAEKERAAALKQEQAAEQAAARERAAEREREQAAERERAAALKREQEEALKREQDAERERAEALKREQAEALKREQAAERERAAALKREQEEALKREQAAERERADALKRERAEALKREQAEALKREQAAERERAEALKREQAAERERAEALKREQAAERERAEALKREQAAERERAEALKREQAAERERAEALKRQQAKKRERAAAFKRAQAAARKREQAAERKQQRAAERARAAEQERAAQQERAAEQGAEEQERRPRPSRRARRQAEQPSGARRARLRLTILGLAGGLAAAVLGFLVAQGTGGHAGVAALSRHATAGDVRVSYPSDWRRRNPPATPQLGLANELALVPTTSAPSALLIGTAPASQHSPLPASALAAIPNPPQPQLVSLGGIRFFRYLDVSIGDQHMSVYALPTTAGTILGVCVTGTNPVSFTSSCERVLGSLRLSGAQVVTFEPTVSYASALNAVLNRLNATSLKASAQLRAARNAQAQASAATELAAADALAAAAVRQLDAGSASSANAAIATALTGAGDAYSAVARAAARRDAIAYKNASAELRRATTALNSALAQLTTLGYHIG